MQHTQPVAYPPVVPMPYPPQVLPPQGYPVPPAGYMPMHVGHASQVQQVRQVGMSVTRPAWSLGEIMIVVITCGLAWPLVWLARRGKTTYTTHR
ncbi:hypothetical protein [Thermocatellispora tengchongensis]|uniref:hypothetical protein n=1 Tax=Thermocatellispora tengchongensis TaxID=1073253 RepID=UPI00362A44E8